LPGNVFVEAHLIGSELVFGIEAAISFGRAEAQAGIFAGARNQHHPIRDAGQDGSIAETAVAHDDEHFLLCPGTVEGLAQFRHG
jgi:hypothetical protein